MEITLEKIELVKDRTGVSYKEAKDALEAADGSVVDAIINLEEQTSANAADDKGKNFTDSELFAKIKEIISKGNISKITIKNKSDDVILNLPLNVGVLGAIVAPWGVIFGAIAAAGFNCKIEFVNDKGEVTDINGKVMKTYEKAVQSGQETIDKFKDSDFYNTAKEKTGETIDKIKDSEFYADVKEKSSETFEKLKDKEFYADIKEKGQQTYEDLKNKGYEAFEGFKNKKDDFFQDSKEVEFERPDISATMNEAMMQEPETEIKLDWQDNIGEIKQYGADLFKRLDNEDVAFGEKSEENINDELAKFIEKLEENSDFTQE